MVAKVTKKSGYNYFMADTRSKVQADTFAEVSREIGRRWRALSAGQKIIYNNKAAKNNKRFEAFAKTAAYKKQQEERLNDKINRARRRIRGNGEPKRVRTAYIFAFIELRGKIVVKYPDLSAGDVAKQIGALWKKMTTAQRAKYEKLAQADKIRNEKEVAVWKKTKAYRENQEANKARLRKVKELRDIASGKTEERKQKAAKKEQAKKDNARIKRENQRARNVERREKQKEKNAAKREASKKRTALNRERTQARNKAVAEKRKRTTDRKKKITALRKKKAVAEKKKRVTERKRRLASKKTAAKKSASKKRRTAKK